LGGETDDISAVASSNCSRRRSTRVFLLKAIAVPRQSHILRRHSPTFVAIDRKSDSRRQRRTLGESILQANRKGAISGILHQIASKRAAKRCQDSFPVQEKSPDTFLISLLHPGGFDHHLGET
jgi:hypothetical protein